MIDILFFAVFAGLIFYKLFTQLGKLDDDEKRQNIKKHINQKINKTTDSAQIIDFRSPIKEDILEDKVKNDVANKIFTQTKISSSKFTEGASKAFELIINGFANGDKSKLKALCEKNTYEAFANQIDEYSDKSLKLSTQLIAIDQVKITDAEIKNGYGHIEVAFKSRQTNYVYDEKKKNITEGSDSHINEPEDIWVFRKKLNSNSPKWLLFSTK